MDNNVYRMIDQTGDNSPPTVDFTKILSGSVPCDGLTGVQFPNQYNPVQNFFITNDSGRYLPLQHQQSFPNQSNYLVQLHNPQSQPHQYLESGSFLGNRTVDNQFVNESNTNNHEARRVKRVLHVEFQIHTNNGEKYNNHGTRSNPHNPNNRNSTGFEDPTMQTYRCKGNIVRHIMSLSWKHNGNSKYSDRCYETDENLNRLLADEFFENNHCEVQKIISINNNVNGNNKGENKKGSSFLVEYTTGIGQEMAQKELNGIKFKVNQIEYSLRIEVSSAHEELTIKDQEYVRLGNKNYPNKWDFKKYPFDGLPGPSGVLEQAPIDVIQGKLQSDLHAIKYNQNSNIYNLNNNHNNYVMTNTAAIQNQKRKNLGGFQARRSASYGNDFGNDQYSSYIQQISILCKEKDYLKTQLAEAHKEIQEMKLLCNFLVPNYSRKTLTDISEHLFPSCNPEYQTSRDLNIREDFTFTIQLKNTAEIKNHLPGKPEIDRPDKDLVSNKSSDHDLAGKNREFCVENGILNFTFYKMMDDIFTLFGLHADVSEIRGFIKNPWGKNANEAIFILDIMCKGYSIDAYCSQDNNTSEGFGKLICNILNDGLENALYGQSPIVTFENSRLNRDDDIRSRSLAEISVNANVIDPTNLYLIDIKTFHAKKDVHRYRLMNPINGQKSSRDGNGPKVANGQMTDRIYPFYGHNNFGSHNNHTIGGTSSVNKSNNKHQLTKPSKYLHISNFERSEANRRGNHPKDDRVKLESIEELEEKLFKWWIDRYPAERTDFADFKDFQTQKYKIVKYNKKNKNLDVMMTNRNNSCSVANDCEPESGYRTNPNSSGNDSGEFSYQNDGVNQFNERQRSNSAAEKPWIVIEFDDIPTAVKGLFAFHSKEVKKDKNLHLRVAFSENKENFVGNSREKREEFLSRN